eukprot:scaffold8982_cov125-Isochrysis_galbana.AAC.6
MIHTPRPGGNRLWHVVSPGLSAHERAHTHRASGAGRRPTAARRPPHTHTRTGHHKANTCTPFILHATPLLLPTRQRGRPLGPRKSLSPRASRLARCAQSWWPTARTPSRA